MTNLCLVYGSLLSIKITEIYINVILAIAKLKMTD